MRELPWPRRRDAADVYAELAADGVVSELSPQPGDEPATDQRDLQHGMGGTLERQAGVVREYWQGSERNGPDGAGGDLHDNRPCAEQSQGGDAPDQRPRHDGKRRAAGADDAGTLSEVRQPDGTWTLFDGAVPHPPTERTYELRDMPPMKTTRENEMETRQASAQVVTAIAPAAPAAALKLTLAEVKAKLDGKTGKRYWKNLDELAETPGFDEMLAEEF